MAPDLAQPDDAPSFTTGRVALGFVVLLGATAALAGAFYVSMQWLNAHHAGRWTVMGATVVYGALIIALVTVWSRSMAARLCMVQTAASKRYRRRMLVCSSLYVAGLFLAIFVNGKHPAPGVLAYCVALLPALPVAGMFVAMGLYLREETDEFQRAVQIESSLWATGAVLVISAGWGFLEMFLLAPHVEAWVLVPLWAILLGFANAFTRRRYR